MKKTMLVDADGVLLNWGYAFDLYMAERGYLKGEGAQLVYNVAVQYDLPREEVEHLIQNFNESAMIGFLPPLRDAIEYITKLADEGWQFICITSVSKDPYAIKLRTMNLNKLFGPGVFADIICLDTGADKTKELEKFKDSGYFWVEDKVENALIGKSLGMKPLVMEHGFNMNDDRCPRVKNWKEIYEIVA